LPVVLYGCETWSLVLREENGLERGISVRALENRALRRILVPKEGGSGGTLGSA
jgi:hypothetical protein